MLGFVSAILIPEGLCLEASSVSCCQVQRTWTSQECYGQEGQEASQGEGSRAPGFPAGPLLSYHPASVFTSSSDR